MSVDAVCPGSFDPITNGHLDVIERASARFDRVVVAVLRNQRKAGTFTVPERIELIQKVTGHLTNVEVDSFEGLLVDFCNQHDIGLICKGLRAVSDFEYEMQMAQMNMQVGGIETVFLSTSPEWSYLSSSLVKEVARFGGSVAGTVPEAIQEELIKRMADNS